MKFVLYIVIAVLILLFMVLIHELGHYIAGKILKFKIDEFSVGFGPKLLQKTRKNGEKITLRAVPLGGYCAFTGDDETEDPAPDVKTEPVAIVKSVVSNGSAAAVLPSVAADGQPFNAQAPWKRIIVLAAGAVFNFVSAIIFAFIYILIVGYGLPVVQEVYSGGNVPYCELLAGDKVLAIDDREIGVMDSYAELVSGYGEGDSAIFTILRDGNEMQVVMTMKEIKRDGQDTYYGFGFATEYESINGKAGDAFIWCVPYTLELSWSILGSFGKIITGQIALTELSGPIGTVTTIAEYSLLDWRYILLFLPLIASNLAIFNLLPIPALDGMKIIFTIIEWIRKKPVSRKIENIISTVGLFILFGFVILVDVIGFFMRL